MKIINQTSLYYFFEKPVAVKNNEYVITRAVLVVVCHSARFLKGSHEKSGKYVGSPAHIKVDDCRFRWREKGSSEFSRKRFYFSVYNILAAE